MNYSLQWLPDVLRAAGLDVKETPGWQTRGHGDVRDIRGVMCHHTCGPKHGDIADLGVLIAGRPDLQGPLCELGLGRSGTFYVVAAGKPWHAGAGNWQGITDGNSHMIGIEAENTGLHDDPWPPEQMTAYIRGTAAILKHIGAHPIMACGHKEYALPRGRKDDPSFDMNGFRAAVGAAMGVSAAPPAKPAAQIAFINTDGANVRVASSGTAAVVMALKKGSRVEVHAQAMNGATGWSNVSLVGGSGKSGWIATRFLGPAAATDTTPATAAHLPAPMSSPASQAMPAPAAGDDDGQAAADAAEDNADDQSESAAVVVPPNSVQVEVVKRRLDSFGYHEFGIMNGDWGGKTAAAIAAYKNDRGLRGEPVIDDALLADFDAAQATGFRRPVAEARANATATEISDRVPAVRQSLRQKLGAKVAAIGSGFAALFSGVSGNFQDASDKLAPVGDFFGAVPAVAWFAIVAVAAGCLWYMAEQGVAANVKDFNEGKRV